MAARHDLTPAEARAQIESGRLAPLYVLVGSDDRAKLELAALIADTVDEEFRPFNVERFYGAETKVPSLVDAARTLPLMASRRVLIVQQAETLLAPKREESEAAERDAELLDAYFEAPEPHAVVVLLVTSLDERRRLVKRLRQKAVAVRCGGASEVPEAVAWIREQGEAVGIRMTPEAVRLIVERSGADSAQIRTNTERLLLYAAGKGTATAEDVRETIAEAGLTDEWAMVNALESGDAATALRELALKIEAAAAPMQAVAPQILGQIRWLVTKPRGRFPQTRLKEAMAAVFRTDLALKTSGGDPRILLERLIVELCEGKRSGAPAPARGRGPGAWAR